MRHLRHTLGGRIKNIAAIAHDGAGSWYFIGAVQWNDGRVTAQMRIDPQQIRIDGDDPAARWELDALFVSLRDYLDSHGAWNAKGRWTPHDAMNEAVYVFPEVA